MIWTIAVLGVVKVQKQDFRRTTQEVSKISFNWSSNCINE